MKKILVLVGIAILSYSVYAYIMPTKFAQLPMETMMLPKTQDTNLMLVNKEVALQQDPTSLVPVPQHIAQNIIVDTDLQVQPQVIEPLRQMLTAAQQDGIVDLQLNSAYRSSQLQQQLFDEKGAAIALPAGYSEHQLGLALDIGVTTGMIEDTAAARWLERYAKDYGFILRYPAHKVAITGISFEPWHFRYVGKPHSDKMAQQDWVLEEYLDYLQQHKNYTHKVDGVTYAVQYVHTKNIVQPQVEVPQHTSYTVSADNIGGAIITTVIEE